MAYYTDEQLEKMRSTLSWAKENPEDPKSQEIQKRIQSGQMNFELKALGLKPVPVEKPKVDLQKAIQEAGGPDLKAGMSEMPEEKKESVFVRMVKDIPSDLKELQMDMGLYFPTEKYREAPKGRIQERADKILEIYEDEEMDGLEKAANLTARGGLELLSSVIDGIDLAFVGTAKTLATPSLEEDTVETIQDTIEGIPGAEENIIKWATWYNNQDRATQLKIDGGLKLLEAGAEVGTLGLAAPAIDYIKQIIKRTAKTTMDVAGPAIKTAAETGEEAIQFAAKKADEAIDTGRAARLSKQEEVVDEATKRIVQGKPQDLEAARRALSEVNIDDIRTYKDLGERMDDTVEILAKKQDAELGQYTERFSPETSAKYEKVGEKTVITNPVDDALDGLETAYRKSGEAAKAERISQLRDTYHKEGLTVKEMNDIAREYGIEFRDRAFTKTGDPKVGYNAEAFENIRSDIKTVVRDRLPSDLSKELDLKMSDIYQTRGLVDKMETKVFQEMNRLPKQNAFMKALGATTGAVANVADLLTGRLLSTAVNRAAKASGIMTKRSVTPMEIEKELSKLLKEFDKLSTMKQGPEKTRAVQSWVENLHPGLGIKNVGEEIPPDSFKKGEIPQTTDQSLLTEAHVSRDFDEFKRSISDFDSGMSDVELRKVFEEVQTRNSDPALRALEDYKLAASDTEGAGKELFGALDKSPETSLAIKKASQEILKEDGVTTLYRYGDVEGNSWSTKPQSFFENGRPLQELEVTDDVLDRVVYVEGAEVRTGKSPEFSNSGEGEVILRSPSQTTKMRGIEIEEVEAPEMFHGTRDSSWFRKGEKMTPSSTGMNEIRGIYFTTKADEAGEYARMGSVRDTEAAVLNLKLKEDVKLASIDEGDYENMLSDALKEMNENPEKFGVDKYGVNYETANMVVQEELAEQGFGGVLFKGKNVGVIFDDDFAKVSMNLDLGAAKDRLLNTWTYMPEGSSLPEPSADILNLDLPKPDDPITLFRGTVPGEDLSDRLSSWSSLREVAEEHAKVNGGEVVEKTFQPNEVLVSLTDLSPEDIKKYNILLEEEEFIVKPIK